MKEREIKIKIENRNIEREGGRENEKNCRRVKEKMYENSERKKKTERKEMKKTEKSNRGR